jgi:hypothetical protein
MPYVTTGSGRFDLAPHLSEAHLAYLLAFSRIRHMRRVMRLLKKRPDPLRNAVGLPLGRGGAYYVGGSEGLPFSDDTVTNSLLPPYGQPGLYCRWTPTEDGSAIVWKESGTRFVEWLDYVFEHFLAPWGYDLCGRVEWQGSRATDRGAIRIEHNLKVVIDLEEVPVSRYWRRPCY